MASTSVSNIGLNSATWTITGLGSAFTSSNYISAGICSSPVSSSGQSSISGLIDYVTPAQSSTPSKTVTGLSSNTTYTWYGFARAANGTYYGTSSVTFKTLAPVVFSYFTMSPSTDTTKNAGDVFYCTTRAYYSDGSNVDVTNSTTWTTGNPSVATITSGGKVTCVSAGTTKISATYNGGTLYFWLTVNSGLPTVTSVTISPTSVTKSVGDVFYCYATAYYSDGSTKNISTTATWISASPSHATVVADSYGGKVTCIATANLIIRASYEGKYADCSLSIVTPTLATPTLTAREDIASTSILCFEINGVANATSYQVVTVNSSDVVTGTLGTYSSAGLQTVVVSGPVVYNLKVRAKASGYNDSSYSSKVVVRTPTVTPTLTIIGATTSSVTFDINPVTCTSYKIELRNNSGTIIGTPYTYASSGRQTITGLSANTSYSLVVYAVYTGYMDSLKSSPYSFTTQDNPQISAPTLNFTAYSTYITYQVTQPTNAVSYYISLYADNDGLAVERKALVTSSGGYTTTGVFTGLTPNNVYNIVVTSNPATGYRGNSTSQYAVCSVDAKVTISGITSTTASVTVNSLEYNENLYTTINAYLLTVDGGTAYTSTTKSLMASPAQSRTNTNTVQFTALPSGRTLEAVVILKTTERRYDASNNRLADVQTSYTIYSSTFTTSSRPSNWTAFDGYYSGMPLTVSGTTVYIMTATTWNNFCTRINDFRNYKGLSDYTFTTVAKDMDFTATIFNQAVNALKANSFNNYFTGGNTPPSTVTSGADIYADYFKKMANCINSIT